MIKIAKEEDIPAIIEMSKTFYNYAVKPFKLGLNLNDLEAYCKILLYNPLTTILVLQYKNKIEGMITGIVSPWITDSKNIIVTEQWWWVNPEIRNKVNGYLLVEALIIWSKKFKATHLVMVSMFLENQKIMKRFYKIKGFIPLETCYIKEI